MVRPGARGRGPDLENSAFKLKAGKWRILRGVTLGELRRHGSGLLWVSAGRPWPRARNGGAAKLGNGGMEKPSPYLILPGTTENVQDLGGPWDAVSAHARVTGAG